jgi:hypothetical protein
MDDEVALISDGDGLAVIGESSAVERFLVSEGLQSQSKDLGLHSLSTILFRGAEGADLVAAIAAGSGRWVQLSQESAQAINKHALMVNSITGLKMGVVQGSGGQIQKIVQFAPGAILTNPAILAGAVGIMAQLSMQQAMKEIKDYLASIDVKLNDVLRAQKDSVFADMIGVDMGIENAMTVRDHVGRVPATTWDQVQNNSATLLRTQAYVLRALDAIAEKLEHETNMADLAGVSTNAESQVKEWLAVLARCFQLQDAMTVLELDRVIDSAPDELTQHRLGLKAARQDRLRLIARSTERLMARMDAAASRANTKVLLHPISSRTVVDSTNQVSSDIVQFNGYLGIHHDREIVDAKRWRDAATDARDKAIDAGAVGVDVAGRVGGEAVAHARSISAKVARAVAERGPRRHSPDEEDDPLA